MSKESLSRLERVRSQGQFDALFSRGKVGKSRLVLVRALPNGLPHSRMAPAVSRKAGKAVARNRIRRRLRAVYRCHKATLPQGYDFVFLARRGVLEADWSRLLGDMRKALNFAVAATVKQTNRDG